MPIAPPTPCEESQDDGIDDGPPDEVSGYYASSCVSLTTAISSFNSIVIIFRLDCQKKARYGID